jgi:hypothetical protein
MNLRLSDSEADALRRKAAEENRSMQEVAKSAIADYVSGRPERLRAAIEKVRVEDAELLRLLDGNKRLAWAATRVFCLLNGRDLSFAVDEAEALILAVARGEQGSRGHRGVHREASRLTCHVERRPAAARCS